MIMKEFITINQKRFATFHTTYTDSNIFLRYDWDERIEDAIYCTSDKHCYFIYENKKLAGGFTLKENNVSYPFMVQPFDNRKTFWDAVLAYTAKTCGTNEIFLNEIPETDMQTLIHSHNATLKWSKRKMIRPTESCVPVLKDGFFFDELNEKDAPEIVRAVFDSHSTGYTSTVWQTDITEIEEAVTRRFNLFGQTNTLYMSNVVKDKINQKIVGVCIAGIYPDSPHNFSTIHQVSVRPEYQRMGLAEAMMFKSINEAHTISPAITLGVLIGNPAEKLYKKIGFASGPSYSELVYKGA